MFQMVEEYLGKQIYASNPSQGRNTKKAQCWGVQETRRLGTRNQRCEKLPQVRDKRENWQWSQGKAHKDQASTALWPPRKDVGNTKFQRHMWHTAVGSPWGVVSEMMWSLHCVVSQFFSVFCKGSRGCHYIHVHAVLAHWLSFSVNGSLLPRASTEGKMCRWSDSLCIIMEWFHISLDILPHALNYL